MARVREEARVAVLGHLEGLNHVFLHASADLEKAVAIAVNAKMRRVSVCGAAETLLVDSADAQRLLPPVAAALAEAGCALRGDARARSLVAGMAEATEEDWRTEYLAPVISVAAVDGVDGAAAHIAAHGSAHTDAIVAEDPAAAERFVTLVDSAIVLVNASTQFADGGEFGFGAEMGIATDRLHARGPVGAEQLTTYKYVVRGTGQTRPGRGTPRRPQARIPSGAGNARRPLRRLVQPGSRGARPCRRNSAAALQPRPGDLAGLAAEPPEGASRDRRAG